MNILRDEHKYDDIINLVHPVSLKHPRMDLIDRAAQFSPFAALTGYDAAIKETGRLTDQRVELDENEKAILDQKLQMVIEEQGMQSLVGITYFKEDAKKAGGAYVSVTGYIKKIDTYAQMILMKDGTRIPLADIYEIENSI